MPTLAPLSLRRKVLLANARKHAPPTSPHSPEFTSRSCLSDPPELAGVDQRMRDYLSALLRPDAESWMTAAEADFLEYMLEEQGPLMAALDEMGSAVASVREEELSLGWFIQPEPLSP